MIADGDALNAVAFTVVGACQPAPVSRAWRSAPSDARTQSSSATSPPKPGASAGSKFVISPFDASTGADHWPPVPDGVSVLV